MSWLVHLTTLLGDDAAKDLGSIVCHGQVFQQMLIGAHALDRKQIVLHEKYYDKF